MLVMLVMLVLLLVCKGVQGFQEEPLEEEPLGSKGKL